MKNFKDLLKKKENKEPNIEQPQEQTQDDNVIYVDSPAAAKRENRRLKRELARKKRMSILFSILIVIVAIFVIRMIVNREYKGYKIVKHVGTQYENTANYVKFSGNLLKYTPDGVSYINSNGDTVWSAGVDMKMPVAVCRGNYAALADMNGNQIYIFNTEGQVSSLTMPYKICDVDIAKQGAFAVVLESDKTNYINLYDKNGDIVYEMQTTIDMSGYPLDIAISSDGKKLFTSFVKVTGTKVETNLAAYNFGEVGQNSNVDRLVGGYAFDDQIIPKVEFVDNDTVVAFGTKKITVYNMKEKPSKKSEIGFDEDIQSVFSSSKFVGVIIKDEDETNDHLYKMKVYSLKGDKKFEKYIDFDYDNVYANKKEIIVSGDDNCYIVRANGKVKYDGKLSGKISSVVPSSNRLEYVVAYDTFTEIIKLKPESGVSGENSNNEETTAEETSQEEIPAPVEQPDEATTEAVTEQPADQPVDQPADQPADETTEATTEAAVDAAPTE